MAVFRRTGVDSQLCGDCGLESKVCYGLTAVLRKPFSTGNGREKETGMCIRYGENKS